MVDQATAEALQKAATLAVGAVCGIGVIMCARVVLRNYFTEWRRELREESEYKKLESRIEHEREAWQLVEQDRAKLSREVKNLRKEVAMLNRLLAVSEQKRKESMK